jgi:hypothetical protein
MNTTEQARAFQVTVRGLPDIHVWGEPTVGVPAATSRMVPVKVRAAPAAPGTHPIEFEVRALGVEAVAVTEHSVFIVR